MSIISNCSLSLDLKQLTPNMWFFVNYDEHIIYIYYDYQDFMILLEKIKISILSVFVHSLVFCYKYQCFQTMLYVPTWVHIMPYEACILDVLDLIGQNQTFASCKFLPQAYCWGMLFSHPYDFTNLVLIFCVFFHLVC
jgi:hypothetical protein